MAWDRWAWRLATGLSEERGLATGDCRASWEEQVGAVWT